MGFEASSNEQAPIDRTQNRRDSESSEGSLQWEEQVQAPNKQSKERTVISDYFTRRAKGHTYRATISGPPPPKEASEKEFMDSLSGFSDAVDPRSFPKGKHPSRVPKGRVQSAPEILEESD